MSEHTESIRLTLQKCPGCDQDVTGKAEIHYEATVRQDGTEPKLTGELKAQIGRVRIEHHCNTTNHERRMASERLFADVIGGIFTGNEEQG